MKGNVPKTSIVSKCFSLDMPNFRILEYFSKFGISSRKAVGVYNSKYSPYLSSKQVGRRIESLAQLGYLQQTASKKIGNLKDKVEIFYDLTIKGFLASLHFTKLVDTVYFKKYLEFIATVDKNEDKSIKPFVITFVENRIEYLLTLYSLRGIKLDSITDIPNFFRIYDTRQGLSNIENLVNLDKMSQEAYDKFDSILNIDSKIYPDVTLWVDQWIDILSLLFQGLSIKKILNNQELMMQSFKDEVKKSLDM